MAKVNPIELNNILIVFYGIWFVGVSWRRDWSEIAKSTQLKVLEAILREGSKEKGRCISHHRRL